MVKEKGQKDKQRSTKHTHKTKDQVTRTPLRPGGELRCSGRVSSDIEQLTLQRITNGIHNHKRYASRKHKHNLQPFSSKFTTVFVLLDISESKYFMEAILCCEF